MTKRKGVVGLVVLTFCFSTLAFQNCTRSMNTEESLAEISELASVNLTPAGDNTTPTETAVQQTTYDPILADRYYVTSLLDDVFGPTARTVNSAPIPADAVNFGSPCSLYENYAAMNSAGKWIAVDANQTCSLNSSSYLSVGANPSPQVSRQATMAHACSDLTSNMKTLRYALTKISPAAVPDLTRENLLVAFQLFYRNHPDPQDSLLQSLQVKAPASGPTVETWRNILYTICASSHWQVL